MADGTHPDFLDVARGIVAPRPKGSVMTLFDTSHVFDAGLAGLDGPRDPSIDNEGFRIVFDGRGPFGVLEIVGPDGETKFYGSQEIKQLVDAAQDALAKALRMEGAA